MDEKFDTANQEKYDPIEMIKRVIEKILDVAFKSSINELAEIYSEDIDRIIVESEKNKKLLYIGGEFKVTYVTETVFSIKLSLYYKNENDQWVEESYVTSREMKMLKEESVKELKENKKIVYEIEHPKGVRTVDRGRG